MHLPPSHLLTLPLLSTLSLAIPLTTYHHNLTFTPPTDPSIPDPNYNTSYPGPVRAHEWDYYSTQYSPDWFRANLDSVTGTACLCSSSPSQGAYNQIASFVRWDFYSHFQKKMYSMHHICPPSQYLAGGDNHCWSAATGSHYNGAKPDQGGAYCMKDPGDGEELCVDWAVEGKRWMTWHGHKRNFDEEGTYTWVPEVGEGRVENVCGFKCQDLFLMGWDVGGGHGGSFVRTWFPPKPIPWG